jgi:hypothetical protein
VLTGLGLTVVGDAARYLNNSPANVEVRRDIRQAGLDLVGALNQKSGRYDRVVVVGHSLGSIIAYDVLTHLWQMEHAPARFPASVHTQKDIDLMGSAEEDAAALRADGQVAGYRERQRLLLARVHQLGINWRVTDLVTIGSPLGHAPWLMAGTTDEFERMKAQRELPTCPPRGADPRDRRLVRPVVDDHGNETGHIVRVLHHGAMFACVRWTNLHFTRNSDPIAGPVRRHFGDGIVDVALRRSSWLKRLLPTSHTRYWREPAGVAELVQVIADAAPPEISK